MVENSQSDTFLIHKTDMRQYSGSFITLFHCDKILNFHIKSNRDNSTTINIDGCEHKIVAKREDLINKPAVSIYDNETPITFSLGWKG